MKRFASYPHNGALIQAAHDLGHVRGLVLDATFGKGTWWRSAEGLTQVTGRIAMDLHPVKARRALDRIERQRVVHGDFRRPPFRPGSIQTVFYDPRYKLNGTPTPDEDGPDERYGADAVKPWRQIMDEMADGIVAWPPWEHPVGDGLAPLVAPGGRLLAKCQDQVCSGRMRWQTLLLIERATAAGLELVDRLDYEIHPRTQPEGRRQRHAEGNYSTLLIFGRPPIRLRPVA